MSHAIPEQSRAAKRIERRERRARGDSTAFQGLARGKGHSAVICGAEERPAVRRQDGWPEMATREGGLDRCGCIGER